MMNAEQYLNVALGGNMNISTLTPLAWHEIMEDYAKYRLKQSDSDSVKSCKICGCTLHMYEGYLRCAECEEKEMKSKKTR